jgi:hypothetical protein
VTALPLREADWTRTVIEAAQLNGWRVGHFRPAQTAKGWRTPMSGHVGVPDLLLARGGDVLMAELKTDKGRLRPEQVEWLAHLGGHGCVWRPRDSDAVMARLARRVTA